MITPERAAYYRLGFYLNDESTWTAYHLPVLMKGGKYFGFASNHEKYVWEGHTEPKVVDVFEKLWETKELTVSFDGQNITLPCLNDLTWSPWPHCDQSLFPLFHIQEDHELSRYIVNQFPGLTNA